MKPGELISTSINDNENYWESINKKSKEIIELLKGSSIKDVENILKSVRVSVENFKNNSII